MPQGTVLWFCVVFTVLATLFLLSLSRVEGGQLRLWRPVSVSLSRIRYSDTGIFKGKNHSLPEGIDATLYCSKICTLHDWCNVWCPNPSTSPTQCYISSLIIMPTYLETIADAALTCYTSRPKDFATNARITAGETHQNENHKIKENLVDGIYNYSTSQCYRSTDQPDQTWFALDFGKRVTFSQVILMAHGNKNLSRVHFTGIEVRVGNMEVTPPTGFANYDLFGVFPGEAEPNQVVVFQSPKPVSARFMSVQKMVDNDEALQVCHIQVY